MLKYLGTDDLVTMLQIKSQERYFEKMYRERKSDVIIDTVGVQALYANCPIHVAEGKSYLQLGVLLAQKA